MNVIPMAAAVLLMFQSATAQKPAAPRQAGATSRRADSRRILQRLKIRVPNLGPPERHASVLTASDGNGRCGFRTKWNSPLNNAADIPAAHVRVVVRVEPEKVALHSETERGRAYLVRFLDGSVRHLITASVRWRLRLHTHPMQDFKRQLLEVVVGLSSSCLVRTDGPVGRRQTEDRFSCVLR